MTKLRKRIIIASVTSVILMSSNVQVMATSSLYNSQGFGKTESEESNKPLDIGDFKSTQIKLEEQKYSIGEVQFHEVSDKEVKGDHRYGREWNEKDPTYLKSDFLDLRIMMEKAFNSPSTRNGGSGVLYKGYFNSKQGNAPRADIAYSRAYMNAGINKLTENNKEVLAQIAAATFADIDGTEPYAHLIPSAVYYGLYDGMTFETVEVANEELGYEVGDVLFKGEKMVTYAEGAVMISGWDNMKKSPEGSTAKALDKEAWYYGYFGNMYSTIAVNGLNAETVHSNMSKAEFARNIESPAGLKSYSNEAYKEWESGNKKNFSKDTLNSRIPTDAEFSTVSAELEYIRDCYKNPQKGAPIVNSFSLAALKKAGVPVEDANGNSNWNKHITRGEALTWLQALSENDIGSYPQHLIEK